MSYDNGQPFTTKDVDNDKSSDTCAERRKGGWWYGACGHCNLNGVHYPSSSSQGFTGIWWGHWHDSLYSLKASAMLIQLT